MATMVQRAKSVCDALANYTMASGDADKWAGYFFDAHAKEFWQSPPAAPTAAQKAYVVIAKMRAMFLAARNAAKATTAGDAAAAAERATTKTEATTDFGAPDPAP